MLYLFSRLFVFFRFLLSLLPYNLPPLLFPYGCGDCQNGNVRLCIGDLICLFTADSGETCLQICANMQVFPYENTLAYFTLPLQEQS